MGGRGKRICVFTGSSPGARLEYRSLAGDLGNELVSHGYDLVYGGAKVGLMGVLADSVLANGGSVSGVITQALVHKEVAHEGLSDLQVVSSMHERKQRQAELADGFIALPGGLGTLEEFFEILTWAQLGIHAKPCGLLNVCGYFDPLLVFLDHAVSERFVTAAHRGMILVEETPSFLLDRFESYEPPSVEKWIDRDE